MCFSVTSYQTGTVYGKNHMQILNADIMYHLIISPLQKRGIYCNHRLQSCGCQSCGKGHRMLFGNAHIKKTIRKHIMKPLQSGSVRHCCCNSHYIRLTVSHLPHNGRKNICIIGFDSLFLWQTGFNHKWLCSMESGRMTHRRFIALSLLGTDMQQNCTVYLLCFFKCPHQLIDIMSVIRSQIGQPHLFKQHARYKKLLDAVFRLTNTTY